MKRSTRQDIARQTLEVLEQGTYTSPTGRTIDISREVQACVSATRYLAPEELPRLRECVLARPCPNLPGTIEVCQETTLAGIARLNGEGERSVAALNFASAKNPGGGFLGGSQAQEESLARSSGLYPSLLQARAYYDLHRDSTTYLYSDAMIVSPNCPVIRDDEGTLLDPPHVVTFITSCAPNAGAAASNRPEELAQIPDTFRRRAEYVLAVAADLGVECLVLGAWGCGVFRNDPALVANTFRDLLRGPTWAGRFRRVVFSIHDGSADQGVIRAFRQAFAEG